MKAWLIGPLVLLVGIGVGAWLRARRRLIQYDRAPLTMKWRDQQAYKKDGDRGK